MINIESQIELQTLNGCESLVNDQNRLYPFLPDCEISFANETRPLIEKTNQEKNLHSYIKNGETGELLLVDYVLAWSQLEDLNNENRNNEERQQLHSLLRKEGLILEEIQPEDSMDKKTGFVKIHGTWDVLSFYAEFTHTKMPIVNAEKKLPTVKVGHCKRVLNNLCDYFFEKYRVQEDYVCTASFRRDQLDLFLKPEIDKTRLFTHAQRSLLVDEAIRRSVQIKRNRESKDDDENGLENLISSDVYKAAFPLHEGPFEIGQDSDINAVLNDRQILYDEWALWKNWYKYQPLHKIRRYFGERTAFYFCWLGFYTSWLVPIAICGLSVFIYGLFTLKNNAPSNEICDSNGIGGSIMCPLCDKACSYWRLSSSCLYSKLSHVFDNRATIAFAVFMSLWATLFLEFWKRRENEIKYEWDVKYFEREECVRPEYEEACGHKFALNVVTGEPEPHLPLKRRVPRYLLSFTTVIFMTSLVIAALVAVMTYRVIMVTVVYTWGDYVGSTHLKGWARPITFTTAGIIQVVLIFGLNQMYRFLAIYITNIERPRTETDYEDSFTLKMYCFQFVNHYASLFYIAFFKGLFVGRPGSYQRNFFGYRLEECDPAGCLVELCLQMITIFGGQIVINNFIEFGVPWLKTVWRNKKEKEEASAEIKKNNLPQFEIDLQLDSIQRLQLFYEYLEMVIQYGFVSIFVAAFPLAPLFALLNNIIEIRLDALKLVTFSRRPLATKAQNIGVWNYILRGISIISVITNALIIGCTSDAVPKMVYRYYYSNNTSLDGFVAWHLSDFDVHHLNISDRGVNISNSIFSSSYDIKTCMYRGLRQAPNDPDPYSYNAAYWHVLCARCIFILVFEHFVFFFTSLITWLVPDVSRKVKIGVLQERYQVNQAMLLLKNKNI